MGRVTSKPLLLLAIASLVPFSVMTGVEIAESRSVVFGEMIFMIWMHSLLGLPALITLVIGLMMPASRQTWSLSILLAAPALAGALLHVDQLVSQRPLIFAAVFLISGWLMLALPIVWIAGSVLFSKQLPPAGLKNPDNETK